MSNKIYRHRYYLRRLWKTNYGHIEVNDKPIPKFLLDANVKIENVNKWTSDILPKPDKWVLPNDPRFHKQELKNDINYQIEPAYIVTQNIKSSAGFPQAMNLTNTVVSDECFPEYFKNISQVPNEGMDELVKRLILYAHVFHYEREKLPRRKPLINKPIWKFKAEIGITHETIVSIMTRGLLRYILSSKPTLDVDMVQNIDTLSLYNYIKNVPIILKNKYTCGLYTTKLFEPFLEHDKVKKLSELKRIPSLFPYSHILDLKKTHIYDKQNTCQRGWKIAKLNYLSTSFMSIPTHSNLDYIKSILLYSAYSQAIQLKTLYRSNSKNESELENPACIKTIATDGEFFHICHFQLNSLNFSDNSKLKNVAWFDMNNRLFLKKVPHLSRLRNTTYENYDSKVFKKLFNLIN